MIHENAGRIVRVLLAHVFHRFVFLLPSCVASETGPGKNVKTAIFADVGLHGVEHGRFIRDFTDTCFAQRQEHVRD